MTDHSKTRRRFLQGSAVALGAGLAGCTGEDGGDGAVGDDGDVSYDNFPERDVTIAHHGSIGGGYDTYTRLAARYLPEYLPGDASFATLQQQAGAGRIMMEDLYNEDPDGYFIGMVNEDIIPVTLIEEDLDVDPGEFNVFGNFSVDINSIWVGEHTGIGSVEEFADRTEDGELTCLVTTRTGAMLPSVMGEITGWYSADRVMDNLVVVDERADGIRQIGDGDISYSSGSWATLDGYRTEEGGPLEALLVGDMTEDGPAPDRHPGAATLQSADVPDGQTIMDLTVDGRTLAGPPGMDDELVQLYRDALESVANDDDFEQDLEDAGRPLGWVDGEAMQESFVNRRETWEEHTDLLEAMYG